MIQIKCVLLGFLFLSHPPPPSPYLCLSPLLGAVNTRNRPSTPTAHAQWAGLRWLQLPVMNGKVVPVLHWSWRQLITFSLYFTKLSRKFILLGKYQYFA